ncbi:MAG TPA: hypothetical protein PLN48_17195, partial [Lachnospiraceae bacterium]|nr:hypothetical protein [Lachnospiraceae bacterium]
FTYERSNKLEVSISNKNELSEVTGDLVSVKLSTGIEAVDIMSFQRKVRVILYSDNETIDKSSILTLGPGKQEKVELSLTGTDKAVAVVIDEDTKDQLDKANIVKSQMRDLEGLF